MENEKRKKKIEKKKRKTKDEKRTRTENKEPNIGGTKNGGRTIGDR
jgi:hypothetical protein